MPSFLDTEYLSHVRENLYSTLLTQECFIVRNRSEDDGAGGQADTERRVAANVPCRVRPPRGQREGQIADRTAAQADAEILLPVGTDLRETDEIHVLIDSTGPTTDDNLTRYSIIGTDEGRADALCITVLVTKSE